MSEKHNKILNRDGKVKKDCDFCAGTGFWNIRGLANPCMCKKVKHQYSDGVNNLVVKSIENIVRQADDRT